MTTVRIDLKDAATYFGDEWNKKFRAAALRGLLAAAEHGVQTIQTLIIPSRTPSPVDRGTYRAGWRFRATSDGAELWNDDPTAVFVEEGVRGNRVRPGRAMMNALVDWIMRKGIESNPLKARGVAFAIVQRMKQKGIFNQGSNGLGILREFVATYAESYMRDEVEREIKREMG